MRKSSRFYLGNDEKSVRLKNALHLVGQRRPLDFRPLVHGAKIAEQQHAGHAINGEKPCGQGVILGLIGIEKAGCLSGDLSIENKFRGVGIGRGLDVDDFKGHPLKSNGQRQEAVGVCFAHYTRSPRHRKIRQKPPVRPAQCKSKFKLFEKKSRKLLQAAPPVAHNATWLLVVREFPGIPIRRVSRRFRRALVRSFSVVTRRGSIRRRRGTERRHEF